MPEHEPPRDSVSHRIDPAELLRRGALEAERLKKRVAAARAELELLELQDALERAQRGQVGPLEKWFQSRNRLDPELPNQEVAAAAAPSKPRLEEGAGEGTSASEHLAQDPARGTPTTSGHASSSSADLPFDSWEALVPMAEARVAAIAGASRARRDGQPIGSSAGRGDAEGLASDLLAGLDGVQPSEAHRRWVGQARVRGAVASAVAHLALLFLLALVTLKAPPPPAGMSFESVAAVEQKIETVEVTEPAAADVSEAVPEMPTRPVDLSDALESSTAAADVLGETAPPARSGVSTAALTATAEVVGAASSASFFGAAAGGNAFCYVIDGSASMRGGPWEAARAELLKSLASLKPNQRFYIIFYNRQLQAIPGPGGDGPAKHLLYATRENLEHARRWLQTLEIGVGAPPNQALEMAISLEPDAIYLLTDGVTSVDVAGFLRQVNRTQDLIYGTQVRVPIHAIAFYSLEGQELLRRIAADNGGQFVYVPDPTGRR